MYDVKQGNMMLNRGSNIVARRKYDDEIQIKRVVFHNFMLFIYSQNFKLQQRQK